MIFQSQLETDRLIVRPFREQDVHSLVELLADPEVSRFVDNGEALSAADASLWVRNSLSNLERFGYGTGAVIERATAEFIGWAGFARPDHGGEEIIYGLARDQWNCGLGSELVRGMVDFGVRRGMGVLCATVHPGNTRSIDLLEGLRFVSRLVTDPVGGDYLRFEIDTAPPHKIENASAPRLRQ